MTDEYLQKEVERHLKESELNLARLKSLGFNADRETEIFLWFRLDSNEDVDAFSRRLGDMSLRLLRAERLDSRDENPSHAPMVFAAMNAVPARFAESEFLSTIIQFVSKYSASFDRWVTKDMFNPRRK